MGAGNKIIEFFVLVPRLTRVVLSWTGHRFGEFLDRVGRLTVDGLSRISKQEFKDILMEKASISTASTQIKTTKFSPEDIIKETRTITEIIADDFKSNGIDCLSESPRCQRSIIEHGPYFSRLHPMSPTFFTRVGCIDIIEDGRTRNIDLVQILKRDW